MDASSLTSPATSQAAGYSLCLSRQRENESQLKSSEARTSCKVRVFLQTPDSCRTFLMRLEKMKCMYARSTRLEAQLRRVGLGRFPMADRVWRSGAATVKNWSTWRPTGQSCPCLSRRLPISSLENRKYSSAQAMQFR